MIGNVYFEDIHKHIIKHLQSANSSIKLAVSWLTDKEIFNVLLEKLKQGISVSLVTRNDYLNNHPEALPWNTFIHKGGKLYFSKNEEQLHYKFILVGDKAVLCTSYNLTCFANGNNRENVMVFTDADFVKSFVKEHNYLTESLRRHSHVEQTELDDVHEDLHGFYNATVKSDKEKQRI